MSREGTETYLEIFNFKENFIILVLDLVRCRNRCKNITRCFKTKSIPVALTLRTRDQEKLTTFKLRIYLNKDGGDTDTK